MATASALQIHATRWHVFLQPHRASAMIETRIAMGELVLANLGAHSGGTALPTPSCDAGHDGKERRVRL